jgi:hypothetical protein
MIISKQLFKWIVIGCLLLISLILLHHASCGCTSKRRHCARESFSNSNSKEVINIPNTNVSQYKTQPFRLLNGRASNSRTIAMLSNSDRRLVVQFICSPRIRFLAKNPAILCKDDLWKQEKCVVFIRPKQGSPEKYLEITWSPFGNASLRMITNKGCQHTSGLQIKKLSCSDPNSPVFLGLFTQLYPQTWISSMNIDLQDLQSIFKIPSKAGVVKRWMINMFCVRFKKPNVEVCSNNSECEFTAWSPTGDIYPNLHVCSAFREIYID